MSIKNTLQPQKEQISKKFSIAITQERFLNLVNNTLRDEKRAQRFIASVSSAVAVNQALQECDAGSILTAALLGEALGLHPSPQLGQFYMVPYKKRGKNGQPDTVQAQFQLGYKGYIQLAIRSGNYKKINVLAIKEGELIRFDPLEEIIEVNLIEDEDEREDAPTIGYYAMFEYTNGFKKAMYWSRKKMQAHADRYSQAYNKADHDKLLAGEIPQRDLWKYSSFWYKDFDAMAYKTMLRQLISKWGIMSIDMQKAYEGDMAVIDESGSKMYVDGADVDPTPELPPAGTPDTDTESDDIGPDNATGDDVPLDDPAASFFDSQPLPEPPLK